MFLPDVLPDVASEFLSTLSSICVVKECSLWMGTKKKPEETAFFKVETQLTFNTSHILSPFSPFFILRWKLMASTEAVTMLVLQCRAATIPATSSISFMVTPVPETHAHFEDMRIHISLSCTDDTVSTQPSIWVCIPSFWTQQLRNTLRGFFQISHKPILGRQVHVTSQITVLATDPKLKRYY